MTTTAIPSATVAERLEAAFPGVVLELTPAALTVPADRIVEVALFLRDDPELDCKYLNCLTAVDWIDYFDIVYHLSSLAKNHTLVLKARSSHEMPVVPSVNDVWMGANLQEREAYDLMGIAFTDHPSLKRIFLWEGFPGHPLRKDFLALPGGYKPGLQRFPFEFPEGQRGYANLDTTDPAAPPVPRLDQPPPPALPVSDLGPERADLATHAHADAAGQATAPTQGAGSDPAQAGGTAPDPTAETAAPGGPAPGPTSEEVLRTGRELHEDATNQPRNEPGAGT
jgi:NADH-quinone oxidoreductase subunit C